MYVVRERLVFLTSDGRPQVRKPVFRESRRRTGSARYVHHVYIYTFARTSPWELIGPFLSFRSSSLGRLCPGEPESRSQTREVSKPWHGIANFEPLLFSGSTITMPRKYLPNGIHGFPTFERSRRRGMQSCRVPRRHGNRCVSFPSFLPSFLPTPPLPLLTPAR